MNSKNILLSRSCFGIEIRHIDLRICILLYNVNKISFMWIFKIYETVLNLGFISKMYVLLEILRKPKI